jgi:hypothetical protein
VRSRAACRVACSRSLPPDLIAVLETDDDLAVRLMLGQNQVAVSHQTVLNTFLEFPHLARGRLLTHPAFQRAGPASVADDARLLPGRVLELFDDAETTGRAAANTHLPEALMERILDEAVASPRVASPVAARCSPRSPRC